MCLFSLDSDDTPNLNNVSDGTDNQAERGDLITFYNNVYVERVKMFALKYAAINGEHLVWALMLHQKKLL